MSERHWLAESGYSSLDESGNFLPQVQQTNQRDLKDDGTRDWQEQAKALLDNYYPDWENPKSTYMVPAAFPSYTNPDKGHLCEKDVYDLLQEFGEMYKEPMFVVHNHKFKELIHSVKSGHLNDKNWVTGDHDFVIIHKFYGLIFLQVKAREEKKWLEAFRKAQLQIEKDQESIKIFLEKQFSAVQELPVFRYPGFVVMPNCSRPSQTAVPHDNAVFKEDCNNLESFRSWWDKNVVPHKIDDNPEIYKHFLIRFVALVHFEPPLNMQISRSYRQIAKFHTPEQLKILVQSPPQQWITGPAGSGKTALLIKKVLDLAQDIKANGREERILVLAFNKPLCGYLNQTLKNNQPFQDKIDVMTYHKFLFSKSIVLQDDLLNESWSELSHNKKCKIIESSIEKLKTKPPPVEQQYEHIFIDEGQDLYGEDWPELLKLFHNQPVNVPDGVCYFWVMYDSNQHVQPSQIKLPTRYFQNAHRLTRVLRNTENVFKLSKKYFTSIHQRNSEIELAHSEVGLNIKWVNELKQHRINGSSLLINTIKSLLEQDVEKSDIVVLTRNKTESLKLRWNLEISHFCCQNAEECIQEENNQVIVECVRRFKGLESKVVILYDPIYTVYQDGKNQARELMYVAVSRCLCYLIIISTEDGCKWLKSETGIQSKITPSENQPQPNRTGPTSSLQPRASSIEGHTQRNSEKPHEKYGSMYENGPPEHQFTDKEDAGQQASQSDSQPIHVAGCKICEPGDKYIPDSKRENVFKLLTDEVTCNLQFISSDWKPPENLISLLLTKIEHDVYKKHKKEHNSRNYKKELRQLNAEIVRNNKAEQINPVVHKTYEELKMRALQEATD